MLVEVRLFFILRKVGVILRKVGVILRKGGVILCKGGVILRKGGVILRKGGVILRKGGVILRKGEVILRKGGVISGNCDFFDNLHVYFGQVEGIQEFAGRLKGKYAGDKLVDILQKEDEVVEAWKTLLQKVRERSSKLGQSDEYQRLIMMIQNLLLWIEDMRLKMESDDRPKYVE